MKEGDILYIGETAFNNGMTNHIGNVENIQPGKTLTVCYNGSIDQAYREKLRIYKQMESRGHKRQCYIVAGGWSWKSGLGVYV